MISLKSEPISSEAICLCCGALVILAGVKGDPIRFGVMKPRRGRLVEEFGDKDHGCIWRQEA